MSAGLNDHLFYLLAEGSGTKTIGGRTLPLRGDVRDRQHPYDKLRVQAASGGVTTTKATYSNVNASTGYVPKTIDMTPYVGKSSP